ncbi:MAG TPA: long-chain fatty acid transporter, partial [Burkholderiales bacterium]
MRKTLLAAATAVAFAPFGANATNGYFPHGHGMKAKGMGGAAMAMTSDTMGGVENPAAMVFVGDRLDVGVDWFRPDRSARRQGSAGGTGALDGAADGN